MGFIKLAKQLMARGHEVTWISSQQQVERLRSFGFSAEHQPVIGALNLNYFIPANTIDSSRQNYLWLIQQIRLFHALMASRKPALILFDRLLTYAAMAAEELGIPYVGVGTPGGYWGKDQNGTYPGDAPVEEYRQWGETIKNDLGWNKARLDSFWVNSPLFNISFIGRDFYKVPAGIPSAQVHHFADLPVPSDGTRFGVSFGNEGVEAILKLFLECLFRHDWVRDPLDIFLGNKKHLLQELQPKYPSEHIQFHEWVDFSEHFPELKSLTFFGGIGTIWHCIDNGLPMLIVPGLIGDQLYNARTVSRLGLGECFQMKDNKCESLRPVLDRLDDTSGYREKIAALRSINNYSDTMETVCEKLESF